MPRQNGKGPPSGGGRRRGGGRMGGPYAAGPGGDCVCPQCGFHATHIAGQPCNRQKCPECGTTLVRK